MTAKTSLTEKKYRATCETCEAGTGRVRERFAEQQAERHEAATGHEVTVEPVEQTERDDRRSNVVEVFEGP